jgi:hypothetical protein
VGPKSTVCPDLLARDRRHHGLIVLGPLRKAGEGTRRAFMHRASESVNEHARPGSRVELDPGARRGDAGSDGL